MLGSYVTICLHLNFSLYILYGKATASKLRAKQWFDCEIHEVCARGMCRV